MISPPDRDWREPARPLCIPEPIHPNPVRLCPVRATPGDIMVHSQSSAHLASAAKPQGHHGWLAPAAVGTAAALGAAALYTAKMTRDAKRKHPPIGRFLDVDGVRLHYIERGTGEPLVLIHGNGTLIQDFTVNGLGRVDGFDDDEAKSKGDE